MRRVRHDALICQQASLIKHYGIGSTAASVVHHVQLLGKGNFIVGL